MKVQKVLRKEWKIPLINTATCSACGVCVDVCGKRAIDISHPVNKTDFKVFAVITDPKNCVGCSLCANECPLQAIEMEVPKC